MGMRVTRSSANGPSPPKSNVTPTSSASATRSKSTRTAANAASSKSIRARALRACRRQTLKENDTIDSDTDSDQNDNDKTPAPKLSLRSRPYIESPKMKPKLNTPLPRRKLNLTQNVKSKTQVVIKKIKKKYKKVPIEAKSRNTTVQADPDPADENNPEDKNITAPGSSSSVHTKDSPNQKLEVEPKPKAPPPGLDPRILKLLKNYDQNCTMAADSALDYISTSIHHPVFTSFRDYTKTEIHWILSHTAKCHKNLNHIEMAMLCVGILDYLAIGIDNPLYCFGGKEKVDGRSIQKIIRSLKKIFCVWSRTKDKRKNRSKPIIAYLRNLTPRFELAQYDSSFSDLIDELEVSARPVTGNKSKNFKSQQKDSVNSTVFTTTSTTSLVDRAALLELSSNPHPKLVKTKESGDREIDNEIIILDSSASPRGTPTKRPLPSSNGENQIANLDSGSPHAKKSKIDNGEEVKISSPAKVKVEPIIQNAFALMMRKSREMAKAKSQPQPRKTSSIVKNKTKPTSKVA